MLIAIIATATIALLMTTLAAYYQRELRLSNELLEDTGVASEHLISASRDAMTVFQKLIDAGEVRREQWKTMALAFEVLCEAAADGDKVGAENASQVIQTTRDALRLLGEYDD